MKSLTNSLIAIIMGAGLVLAVSAHQSSTSNQQENQGMQGMQGMQGQHGNMNHMMQNCRKNMQPMIQTNRQAKK